MTDGTSTGNVREKLWTPANVVTLVRICCVPVFVVAIITPWPAWLSVWGDFEPFKPWVAAGIFVLLAATDGLDGYLARSRNEVTNFGKFMDPLADKILVAAALLALVELSVIPSWPALIILTREFIVSGIRMVAASQGTVIAASWYGKAKTVTQIIAIVLFIVKDGIVAADPQGALHNPLYLLSWGVMLVALVLTIVSMLDYFVKAKELLGFVPAKKGGKANTAAEAQGEAASVAGGDAAQAGFGGGQDTFDASGGTFSEGFDAPVDEACIGECAARVVAAAKERGTRIGCAESLTGGLIAGALTSVPGSSEVVRGGIVSYASEVKASVLGVDAQVLCEEGAVCERVACQMAEGARRELDASVAVAVTGIAGPGGAEPGKPVGTVWLALADGEGSRGFLVRFSGDRSQVRLKTVRSALHLLEKALTA